MTEWNKPMEQGEVVRIDGIGAIVAGRYVSRKKVQTDKGPSLLHTLELTEPTEGVVVLSAGDVRTVQQFDAGARIQFWGSKLLDEFLSRVSQHGTVRIEYKGTNTLSGGRTMKLWDVRQAKDTETPYEDEGIPF